MDVHFILTSNDFGYQYYLAVLSAMKTQNGKVKLWKTEPVKSRYLNALLPRLQIIDIDAPKFKALEGKDKHFIAAHTKDYLMYKILYEEGGICLDLDTICIKDVSGLLGDKDMVIPSDEHLGQKIYPYNTAILIAKKNSDIAKTALALSEKLLNDTVKWGETGPILITKLVYTNKDKVFVPECGVLGGSENQDIFKDSTKEFDSKTRILHLFAFSAGDLYKNINEGYIETSNSLLARTVRSLLSPEERKPVWKSSDWYLGRGRHYKPMFDFLNNNEVYKILETGTHNGNNATWMIKSSAAPACKIEYYGFDLFESHSPETIDNELTGSYCNPPDLLKVSDTIGKVSPKNVVLYKGDSKKTLPQATLPIMDMIYIDGGHSIETTRADWQNVQRCIGPNTVVFVDDYFSTLEDKGCKFLLNEIDKEKYNATLVGDPDIYNPKWGNTHLIMVTNKNKKEVKMTTTSPIPTEEEWKEASKWEHNWWGNCCNSFYEEQKQFDYAGRMGIKVYWDSQGPHIDAKGMKILDVGGGPVSLLLKCVNLGQGYVIDPCDYPDWTVERYKCAGITLDKSKAEDMTLTGFDEVWIYNLLQHVHDPEKIIKNALKAGKLIRIFDWLEIAGPGHPHYLLEEKMNEWFGGEGKVEKISGGKCYVGIFPGAGYEPK